MTLAIAYRSLGRIVTLSDTKISDPGATRRNAIPGRLKSIVLNDWLTVTYAGLTTQAIDIIRDIRKLTTLSTTTALTHLSMASKEFEGEIDFLVCSHEIRDQPRLVKIANGSVAEGSDMYWIGSPAAAQNFARLELPPTRGEFSLDYVSAQENELTRKFCAYLDTYSDSQVGGLVVNCLASSHGHCYQDHAGAQVDKREIPDPLEPALRQQMDRAGMDGYFTYQVISTSKRGVAVVGMYFEQAGIAYVHVPLLHDDPVEITAPRMEEFRTILDSY